MATSDFEIILNLVDKDIGKEDTISFSEWLRHLATGDSYNKHLFSTK